MNSSSRYYEALTEIDNATLTSKQYLVYAYLMSISIWNAAEKERHYFVYKNTFKVKEVARELGISENTWRSAIRELRKQKYIYYDCDPSEIDNETYKEKKSNKYYIINFPKTYVPLNMNLIKVLVKYGALIQGGGNIVSVYSMIYKYWYYCQQKGKDCFLTVSQISKVFTKKRTKEVNDIYRLMLSIFNFLKIVDITGYKELNDGKEYIKYKINLPLLNLPSNYLENDEPDNIDEILIALENSINI